MTPVNKVKPTIARIWKGRTAKDKAEEYSKYLYEVGFLPLVKKALGAQMFREDGDNETEFITISYWESVEAPINIGAVCRCRSKKNSSPGTRR
ncbi:MAG TPA: hypothetical protein VK589_21775 [Chryseolinea sp.]|nr:hypothetical protein [Chryseolinea sp.]